MLSESGLQQRRVSQGSQGSQSSQQSYVPLALVASEDGGGGPILSDEEVDKQATSLQRWDRFAAFVHFCQAFALLIICTVESPKRLLVVDSFTSGRPGAVNSTNVAAMTVTRTLPVYPIILACVTESLSTIAHLVQADGLEMWYGRSVLTDMIRNKRNPYRLMEYAVTATTVILNLSLILNVITIPTLLAVCACNVSMIMFGDLSSRFKQDGDKKRAFWYGSFAGIIPWVVIGTQLIQAAVHAGAGLVPWFVWSIFAGLIALFWCFAAAEALMIFGPVTMCGYTFGKASFYTTEVRFKVLSVISKSALSWQIYAALATMPPSAA